MVNHKSFIAWAFNRHCSAPHNADFEVCQDKACVRARGYENAQQNMHLTGLESAEQERVENEMSEWGNPSRNTAPQVM